MRIVELVQTEHAALDKLLGTIAYEIADDDETHCRVIADRFTIHLYWLSRERWITSSIQIHEVPPHPLDFHDDIDTWVWLRSRGEEWPQPRSESMSSRQLFDEYERIGRVLKTILSDEIRTKEALIFEAGYSQGYNHWVAVPEYAPPRSIIDWVLDRLKKHPIASE